MRRPRPPSPAAVLLTVPEGAELSSGEVMAEARRRIDLPGLGITNTRLKQAMNGGTLLEVPRPVRTREEDPEPPTSAELADRLADSLREVFQRREVRITRPSKTAEMRLRGLDNSATAGDVGSALLAMGGVTEGDLRIGVVRRSPSGFGTIWVQAPAAFVRRAATAGMVRVGWAWSTIEFLRARPTQCYRCFQVGHTRHRCKSEEDRSGWCYKCGTPGYLAARCTAETPRCPFCAEQGKPSGHRLGIRGCTPPQAGKENRGEPAESQGVPSQSQEADPPAATEAAGLLPTVVEDTMGGGGTEPMEVGKPLQASLPH